MRRVISASRRVRNMGAVPVFGFTRMKSDGASAKQRFGSLMVSVSCRKKAHSVSWNRRSAPPNIRAQNLNRESTSGKKCVSLEPRFSCSQSPNRPDDTSAGGNGLEEPGSRRLVGVYARRREQTDESVRLDEAHGAFYEQRIEVDIAARPAGDSAPDARINSRQSCPLCSFAASNSFARGALTATQLLNGGLPCGRCRGQGQFRVSEWRTTPPPGT